MLLAARLDPKRRRSTWTARQRIVARHMPRERTAVPPHARLGSLRHRIRPHNQRAARLCQKPPPLQPLGLLSNWSGRLCIRLQTLPRRPLQLSGTGWFCALSTAQTRTVWRARAPEWSSGSVTKHSGRTTQRLLCSLPPAVTQAGTWSLQEALTIGSARTGRRRLPRQLALSSMSTGAG